jgi:uncharacterized protein YaaR (DUF327 family)
MKSKKIIRFKSSILKRKSSRVKSKRCKRIYNGGKPKKTKGKKSKNKKSKSICYTGVGANKSGQYNNKSFLKLMNDKFKDPCGRSLNEKNCKPCKNYKDMSKKFMKMIKNPLLNDDDIDSYEYKMDLESINCEMCKNKNIKQCDLNSYIDYSGANYGKC